MIEQMRKTLGIISGSLLSLAAAVPAMAQGIPPQNVTICPVGSQFEVLCTISAAQLGKYVGIILSIMLGIAVIIAIFFLVWGGIKWILSGGDKAAVDEARKHIIAALVGLVIAFLAFFLISIVGSLFGISILNFTLPALVSPPTGP